MGAQLSWESICLTSRGSQVRALLFPPFSFTARQFSWLERQPVTLEVRGSSPLRVAIFSMFFADLAHLVERDLAKVEVAGSIPVIRSKKTGTKKQFLVPVIIRRHGQAVRQRSATPLSPVRFRVAPPRRVDKKDANRKTRDFLGFSSFFAVFLTFLKFGFQ